MTVDGDGLGPVPGMNISLVSNGGVHPSWSDSSDLRERKCL